MLNPARKYAIAMPSPSERRQASKPRPSGVDNARRLRAAMSLPEVLLRQHLHKREVGNFQFRRQRPIGSYVADFYCHQALLVVEIDGKQHEGRAEHEHDVARDQWLKSSGYSVVRVPASDVLQDLAAAAEAIVYEAKKRIGQPSGLGERQPPPSRPTC